MSNKTYIVTGSNNGIGFEAAKALAAQKHQVIMICRSKERGEAARQKIVTETGNLPDLILADLSLQTEVKRAATEFLVKYDRLDSLINVAGFSWKKREVTSEGFERTFALNYLGYFTLAIELVSILKKSAPSRIINIASSTHTWSDIELDNLQGEREFPVKKMSPLSSMYGWTNMMRVMFTYELAERLKTFGVSANALDPGFVPVKRSSTSSFMNFLSSSMQFLPVARTPQEAAETIVWLASSDEAANLTGAYFRHDAQIESAPQSYDKAFRRQLWQRTIELTGYKVDPIPVSEERKSGLHHL